MFVNVSRSVWTGKDVPGAVKVRVSTLPSGTEKGRVIGTRRWVIHSGATRSFRFRVPQRPFRVELDVHPTFVPSDYDFPDERSLGALFGIRIASP